MHPLSLFWKSRGRNSCLLKHAWSSKVTGMRSNHEDRSRYKVSDSHRNQIFIATLRKNRETYAWTWQGHIDLTDGQRFEFSSQRTFATATEAEDYMRRFACDHIDNLLGR